MTVLRPPVTGDTQLDSFLYELSNSVAMGTSSASTTGLPGSGDTAVNAVTLVLYKRWSAATMPFAQEITVESVYKYSTTTLTNSSTGSVTDFDGWYRMTPLLADGAYLYSIQVNIADRGDVDTISFDSWSTPILISNDTEAVDGFNTATVNLYKRNTGSTPATPQGTLTYAFETSTYSRTVTNDGWTTLDAVGTGDVLWRASAVVSSRVSTGTVLASEWYAAILASDGATGTRNASGYIYYNLSATSAPATPTATSYGLSSGSFSGLTANWSRTPPVVTAGDANYWACNYYVTEAEPGGTQTIVFSTPFSSFSFDGLVTFTNLNSELANPASTEITTIDGGLVKTGTIEADRIRVDGIGIDVVTTGGEKTMIIGSGGVKTVNIEDLAVDTFQIAGQAVTAPVLAYAEGVAYEHFTQSGSSGSSLYNVGVTIGGITYRTPYNQNGICYLTAQQLNITIQADDTPVLINFTGTLLTNMRGPTGNNYILFELMRGTAMIKQMFHSSTGSTRSGGMTDKEDYDFNTLGERTKWLATYGYLLNMSHIDEETTAGQHTYSLRYSWLASDSTPNFDNHHSLRNNCAMMAVELKK